MAETTTAPTAAETIAGVLGAALEQPRPYRARRSANLAGDGERQRALGALPPAAQTVRAQPDLLPQHLTRHVREAARTDQPGLVDGQCPGPDSPAQQAQQLLPGRGLRRRLDGGQPRALDVVERRRPAMTDATAADAATQAQAQERRRSDRPYYGPVQL